MMMVIGVARGFSENRERELRKLEKLFRPFLRINLVLTSKGK
jgi:hypothetical protein